MGGSARKGFAQTAFMTIKRPTQNHCSQTETLLLNKVSETIHEKSPTQTSNANANAKTLFHRASSLVDSTKRSTQYYALKSLHLDQCSNEQLQKELQNEVEILKTLDHPHIARALETFEFQGSLYLCLELCSGGDLYSRDPYTEYQAAQILYSLTSAVRYLHAHGIIHRDLKYENCMFTSNFAPVEGEWFSGW